MGYIYTILSYLVNNGETKDRDEFVETVKLGFTEPIGDKVMTIAQQFREEGIIAGRMAGLNEGRIEGLIEGKVEIAIKLIKRNMDIDEIVALTGLSRNEIYELKYQIEH